MALTKVDRETYDRVKAAASGPETVTRHLRHPGSVYYVREYVIDPAGRLVAFHDDTDGAEIRWADVSLLEGGR